MDQTFKFGNLSVSATSEWVDVTNELDAENPPFTLARKNGVGVIQFSAAKYLHGKAPNIKLEDLNRLLNEFSSARNLGKGFQPSTKLHPLLICSQSFFLGTKFLRVWCCSNGRDVALITYLCDKGCEHIEIQDCEKIVEGVQFEH